MKRKSHIKTAALIFCGALTAAIFPPQLRGSENPEEELEIIHYPATMVMPSYCWFNLPVRVLDMPPGVNCINYTDSSTYVDVRPAANGNGLWSFLVRGQDAGSSFFRTSGGGAYPLYSPEIKSVVAPKPTISARFLNPDGPPNFASTKDARMHVSIVPDAHFAANFPKEVRYAVSRMNFLVQMGTGAPTLVKGIECSGKDMVKGVEFDVTPEVFNLAAETKCYLHVNNVYRITSDNKTTEVPFSDRELYIGLIVKPINSGK